MSLWEQLWISQGKRCAGCGRWVRLEDTAKSSYSFKIVCQQCYKKPKGLILVLDEYSNYTDRS